MKILNSFRLKLVLRVLLMLGLLGFLIYAWDHEGWWMTRIFAGLLLIGSVLELIWFMEGSNRRLTNFLLAIKHRDFTLSFSDEHPEKSFTHLSDAFNEVIRSFRELKAEKESHYQYLLQVVEHVGIAMICYDAGGEIILMNQSARTLLARPYMRHLKTLERVDPELYRELKKLKGGEKKLVPAKIGSEELSLSLSATAFRLRENDYILASFQNIRSELDERETDAWQKMIRVLTHEIMNTVTPIVSLSQVIRSMIQEEGEQSASLEKLDASDREDIAHGLATIESRAEGLLSFVHAYRSLARVSQPDLQETDLSDLVRRVQRLLQPELDKRNIRYLQSLPPEKLCILADPGMIEQVLINLIKNGMEALEDRDQGQIELRVFRDNAERIRLLVSDNGPGINAEFADRVFIPFFTTKKKGSGIGLSLARQIMLMHKGEIRLRDSDGEGTTISLTFAAQVSPLAHDPITIP